MAQHETAADRIDPASDQPTHIAVPIDGWRAMIAHVNTIPTAYGAPILQALANFTPIRANPTGEDAL